MSFAAQPPHSQLCFLQKGGLAMISEKMLDYTKIKSISTKYVFDDNDLHYQIVLRYGDGDDNEVLRKDFDNYDEYQSYHDEIVKQLNTHHSIPNEFVQST